MTKGPLTQPDLSPPAAAPDSCDIAARGPYGQGTFPDDHRSKTLMRLSTRNQLAGTVTSIQQGEAMAVVKVVLDGGGGQVITSSITREAVTDLGLIEGSTVIVLVKSTEVTLAVD